MASGAADTAPITHMRTAAPMSNPRPDGRSNAGSTQGRGRRGRGWNRRDAITMTSWDRPPEHLTSHMRRDVVLDMGWGRLIFGQTFSDHEAVAEVLADEQPGRRDIALYLHDPHILVAQNPQELFVDPSYTYRLQLHGYRHRRNPIPGVLVRHVTNLDDVEEVNRIYVRSSMVPAPVSVLWENQQRSRHVTVLVAEDTEAGAIVGTVTGVDHERLFDDPELGSSLWCLAVDPSCQIPGVGEALVRALAERFQARGRSYMDLSVMHDNRPAIRLYEKLGFERVPVFVVKRKNAINERLFAGTPDDLDHCNPYARIIADEALRRGIRVEVLDADGGYLRLSHGGRSIITRESLSELTSAIAMSRCDDKRVTRKVLIEAGLRVPRGRSATFDDADREFLAEIGELVVKPARGEQGQGITVGVTTDEELAEALEAARSVSGDVLLEQRVAGEDLRIVVIDHEVVAAAIRKPASVVGTGHHSIRELIEAQSRRRAAATGGESTIPLDASTEATVRAAGWSLDDVLPQGEELRVRRTANLHTGGTIHDVTAELHPSLAEAAVAASRALDIPVTGLDLMVPAVDQPDYVFIEANERPGLANHEPQPTAERFIDLLFPATRPLPWGWQP
jgi:GNAT-family acetyltransferase (TIGR03103 family)